MSQYIVKPGETISDIVMNSTGSISNWNAIISANNLSEWCPILQAGQSFIIPDSLVNIQSNNLRKLQTYPACNSSIPDIYSVIDAYPATSNWILATGYWNDLGEWVDTAFWID